MSNLGGRLSYIVAVAEARRLGEARERRLDLALAVLAIAGLSLTLWLAILGMLSFLIF